MKKWDVHNSWDIVTNSINNKNNAIINKYVEKQKKDDVLILGSPKNLNGKNSTYSPSKSQLQTVLNLDDEVVRKYPQNWAFRMQGGGNKIKTGSALFNKNSNIIVEGGGAYRMRESTKRFLEGGAIDAQFTKKNKDPYNEKASESRPFGTMLGDALKYLLWDLPKKFGGAELSAQQKAYVDMVKKQQTNKKDNSAKMDLKEEQMLDQKLNPLDKKEVARRKMISGLTDKQKQAYLRTAKKKGVENYNKQVDEYAKQGEIDRRYNEEREWRNTQKGDRQEELDYKAMVKRQAEEKAKEEADKPWYDKLGDLALEKGIPALTKLIPVKELQAPAEKLLNMGVDKMRGNGKRKPSAWNLKVKAYINKHNCSMKEALQALKK